MRTLPILLAVAAFGCGDNIKLAADGGPTGGDAAADAAIDSGSGGTDAGGSDAGTSFPPAPAIGAQIDRMGRPLSSALVDLYGSGDVAAETSAYAQDSSPGVNGATWVATYGAPFAVSLALIDTFDTGFFLGSDGSGSAILSPGCGNQVLYNGQLINTMPTGSASYTTLAGLLADDELFLDASTALAGAADIPGSHANYLGVELAVAGGATIGLPHITCGGRAPLNDVIGASYSALMLGIAGFSNTPIPFMPLISDGATVHADVDDNTFPFLGVPHGP